MLAKNIISILGSHWNYRDVFIASHQARMGLLPRLTF